jgi:carotenoid cleavage dioxygenase
MSTPARVPTFLRGNYAPVRAESDLSALEISGALPETLSGTLYRIGPNPKFEPVGKYHWFTGDGMVHALHLGQGTAAYTNRWVETPKLKAETAHGRALFSGFVAAPGCEELARDVPLNVANTHIVWHGDKLLALDEFSRPTALDPVTLKTQGYHDFKRGFAGAMTAHPKIDPRTGEMLFFAYHLDSADITFHVVDRSGTLVRSERFTAPYASMIHDFMVTEDYVLFPLGPAIIDPARMARGETYTVWDAEQGAYLGVMKRSGPVKDIQWVPIETCYVYHAMNAFNQGTRLTADVIKYRQAPLVPDRTGRFPTLLESVPMLVRWTLDLSAGTLAVQETILDDMPCEFPRTDERFSGHAYRHGFAAQKTDFSEPGSALDTIGHIDLATGTMRRYAVGAGCFTSEPVFVPRAPSAAEGDGYLLATVYRSAEERSDLIVLDAADITAGPIATIKLPVRVPFGFHGNWRPALS